MNSSTQAHSRCPTLAAVRKALKDSASVLAMLEAPVLELFHFEPIF